MQPAANQLQAHERTIEYLRVVDIEGLLIQWVATQAHEFLINGIKSFGRDRDGNSDGGVVKEIDEGTVI